MEKSGFMKFEESGFENVASEAYRWKRHWGLLEFLMLRKSSDEKPMAHTKKHLNPLLVLNIRAILFTKDQSYSYEHRSTLEQNLSHLKDNNSLNSQ